MSFVSRTSKGNYRANWREPSGRQRAKTFTTKRDAKRFLANLDTSLTHGLYVDPHAGRVSFGNHARQWLASRNDELTTKARDISIMRTHVLPRWGDWPLAKIDHMSVQTWVSELGTRRSPATVAEAHRITSAVLRSALRNRLIAFNPCEGIRLPKRRRQDSEDQILSREEVVSKLLPAISDRYRAIVATAAGAGLRWGEAAGLRFDALDLDNRTLRVIRTVVEVGGHTSFKPYPKSGAGRREVPLPTWLVSIIRCHLDQFPTPAAAPVFANSVDKPLRRSLFRSRVWKPALHRAGLPPLLRFHDLRHSYATWLVDDGVPVNMVQRVMGHERSSTTLDLYTRRTNNHDRILDALDSTDDPC